MTGSSPRSGTRRDRRGFALAVVVFLLFAIGVAGALGYRAIRIEGAMSLAHQRGSEAFTAAQAGLQRFMSEVRDSVPGERSYSILGAETVVTSRRILDGPFPHHRYLLRSVGTVRDPRSSSTASVRTIQRMAEHERVPVELLGALASPSEDIDLENVDEIDGRDAASGGACPEAGRVDLPGVVGGGSIDIRGGGVRGSRRSVSLDGAEAVLDSLEARWDVLTHPDFPVEHDGTWPSYSGIPPDSFPTVRWNGDLEADCFRSGRGLLIVTGELDVSTNFFCDLLGTRFQWDGLILADRIDSDIEEEFRVRGSLVVGLDGSGAPFAIRDAGEIRFHSCNVVDAGLGLAHMEPLEGTWWETF